VKPEALEEALASLPFAWRRLEDGSHRLDVEHEGVLARLGLETRWPGSVRVVATGAVALRGPSALEALAHFALETNRRLRLARLCVARAGDAVASVVWDAVLPGSLDLHAALPAAIEAVAAARALTERSLRALADERLASPYLTRRMNDRPAQERRMQ